MQRDLLRVITAGEIIIQSIMSSDPDYNVADRLKNENDLMAKAFDMQIENCEDWDKLAENMKNDVIEFLPNSGSNEFFSEFLFSFFRKKYFWLDFSKYN